VAGGGLALRVLPGELAVVRLDADSPLPAWAELDAGAPGAPRAPGALRAVVRTPEELSVVCPDAAVPDGVRAERGWRSLVVAGPLDLALTGILAGIAAALGDAGVAIFAVATYDTDYVLVRSARLPDAVAALRAAGYDVTDG
jgi:uncharacterized protein